MKIVITASEIAPFIKTGGLADMAGALPKYLNPQNFEIIVIMPLYRGVNREAFALKRMGEFSIPCCGQTAHAVYFSTRLPGTPHKVFFLENRYFFDREGIYGTDGKEYEDNDARFSFFCRGVLEICRLLDFQPDVIHCNDWQTGLIPVYLKILYADDDFFRYTAVLFTIHNLSFHGLFNPEDAIYRSGLPWSVFNMYGTEFHGRFSFLKGGLYFSDTLNTVSERYCREIQAPEQGEGLEGLLKNRSDSLYGILNGVDYEIWNPGTDPVITENYSRENTGDKKLNTRALCEMSGLAYNENTPVTGMITRLTGQKGLDITAEIIGDLSERNMKMIILGTGEPHYHKIFADFAGKYPDKISLFLKYDNELSHMIYAGSDIFLMPSKFEPCGISQMISLKYGTIPVVRETGGLADTITGFTGVLPGAEIKANGFVFREYSSSALLKCIELALEAYSDRPLWEKLVLNAMNCDFSWRESAVKYEKLYKKLYVLKHGI